jgi:hypothetical protein
MWLFGSLGTELGAEHLENGNDRLPDGYYVPGRECRSNRPVRVNAASESGRRPAKPRRRGVPGQSYRFVEVTPWRREAISSTDGFVIRTGL